MLYVRSASQPTNHTIRMVGPKKEQWQQQQHLKQSMGIPQSGEN